MDFNINNLTIRKEKSEDYGIVYDMIKESFAVAPCSNGKEQDFLNNLRKSDTFIPELSLIAEYNNQIVGQIAFYQTHIEPSNNNNGESWDKKLITICSTESENNKKEIPITTQLMLAPLTVRVEYFRKGIGSALIRKGCEIAKNMGYKAVFLCGSPEYYPRHGFKPSFEYKIYNNIDKNGTFFMTKELNQGLLNNVEGTITLETE